MFGWKLFEVTSKRWDVDFVPLRVGPFVFGLKIVSKVCAIDMESDVGVQISVVSNLVDGDRHSGRGDMCRGAAWFCFRNRVEFRREFVNIHVEFCIRRQFIIGEFCILVAFDPLRFDWTT